VLEEQPEKKGGAKEKDQVEALSVSSCRLGDEKGSPLSIGE